MTNPIRAWQQKVFIGTEASWGDAPLPTAAMAIEVEPLDMGPAEQGVVRPRRDKSATRGMQRGFVEGRVEPIPFSLETSVLSRAAANTPPPIIADILEAAGFLETVGGGNVTYAVQDNPTLQSLAILSVLGDDFGEHGRGGVVKQVVFSGGDSELRMRAAGAFIGKAHLGRATGTLQDAADLTLALDTIADADRIGLGFYSIENEVVKVTAVDTTTGILTVVRAQAGTVAAAHNAAVLYPYTPAFAPSGAPLSEAEITVTLDGEAIRCLRFNVDITTGVDHLPGETGSKYVQGGKVIRYDVVPSVDLLITREKVALLGKLKRRKEVALSIQYGSVAGRRVQLSMPYCELGAFPVPAPANDISTVTVPLRCRDDAAAGALSIIFS